MKKIIVLVLLLNSLYADGLQNPSVRPKTQLNTIDFFAKALYWYPSESIDWAFTLSSTPNSVDSTYKSFVFHWSPGFTVGFGYNMRYDQWDTHASYTWFTSKASDRASGAVTSAFLGARETLLELLELFNTAKARINLLYNMFDIDLGRNFYVSSFLSFRPSIGIKGGWITQNIYSNWTMTNLGITATENLEQRFQGGGPKGGIASRWYLASYQNHSFSLMSLFEAGYLWGHWSIDDTFIDNLNTIVFVNTTPRNLGSLVLHTFLGFVWDCNFNRDRSHLAFQIGYELEDWFNQLQIFTDTSGSQTNDLILQGFNFGFNVDF